MTIVEPSRAENRFVTYTDWSGYLKFLDAVGDRPIRVTYDRGKLEIMSPGKKHEWVNRTLGNILETMMACAGIDYEHGGSMTFKYEALDRGLEPDSCYWLAHCLDVRGREAFDPLRDPPPDLVLEVEVTRSAVNRLGIYAAMRVPEVWRYTAQGSLEYLTLAPDGGYQVALSSPSLPWIPAADLVSFLEQARTEPKPQLMHRVREWVRATAG